MKTNLLITAFTAVLVVAAQGASTLTFDTPTSVAGDVLVTNFTLNYGILETEDEFGDPLAVPRWITDTSAPAVGVGDPSLAGYGAAIAGNALDAVLSPVLFVFDSPVDLTGFGITLDNSTFGTLFGTEIGFYDANDALLFSIPVDQAVSGFNVAGQSVLGVSKIVLPSGAFYDNMTFSAASAVPEPSVASLGLLGMGFAFFRRRRRK